MGYTVAVYLIDKAYGGPEEGGWWYEYGFPSGEHVEYMRGFADENSANKYVHELSATVEELNKGRRDINSVLSCGIYRAEVCEGLPKAYPSEKPHYE
jgi:hypothetical protein